MAFDLPPDLLNRDDVLEFFWSFSVFECALKREGFLQKGAQDKAEPHWGKFGKSLKGRFDPEPIPGFGEAVERLKNLSPQRQVVEDGQLRWRPVTKRSGESDEQYVLDLLKTVRNNLFHGGKYPDGPIAEVSRDREILGAAKTVLRACYELHPGIKRWVDEPL